VQWSLASVRIDPSSAAPATQTRDRDGVLEPPASPQPGDGAVPRERVTLSREAQARASAAAGKASDEATDQATRTEGKTGQPDRAPGKAGDQASSSSASSGDRPGKAPARAPGAPLTADQERQLTDLQQRDTHVRQHEAAHQAAGGALVGGASYSYQTGPDGKSYAVGGEVPISLQAGRTADETIANARRVRAAALAPSDPSAQDLSVAAAATSVELAANVRKAREATKAYDKNTGGKKAAGKAGEPQDRTTQRAAEPVSKAA